MENATKSILNHTYTFTIMIGACVYTHVLKCKLKTAFLPFFGSCFSLPLEFFHVSFEILPRKFLAFEKIPPPRGGGKFEEYTPLIHFEISL